MKFETETLDAILKRLWQNGYGINHYEDLRQEIINELCEQLAREIMSKCKNETKTFDYEGGSITVAGCLEYFNDDLWGGSYQAVCTHFEDANLVRGE